jgi:hypothetical protein
MANLLGDGWRPQSRLASRLYASPRPVPAYRLGLLSLCLGPSSGANQERAPGASLCREAMIPVLRRGGRESEAGR